MPIPVVIMFFLINSLLKDSRFILFKKAMERKGSSEPGRVVGGSIKIEQIRKLLKINERLNASIDGAME